MKPGHQHGFSLKSISKLGIRSDVLVHHLDDDIPPEVELTGQKDPTHSSFPKDTSSLIPTQKHTANHT
jgi:hypothetical protein